MFTFQDSVDHLVDYLGGAATDQVVRDSKRACASALRDLANAHRWSYHYTHGRVLLNAPYSTGTVAYDHTGGTYERMMTLTSGVWPTWTTYGQIRVPSASTSTTDSVIYEVEDRKSDTVITLSATLNPGADVTAGATYSLYRDSYELPSDFIAQDQALYQDSFADMEYVHPRDWLRYSRYRYSSGIPRFFSIIGDDTNNGRMEMRVTPPPDAAKTVDFVYQRRPRSLRIMAVSAGSISSAVSGTRTITGVGTAFDSTMIGSVIRLSSSVTAPTSDIGDNPSAFESVITAVSSSVVLLVRDALTSDFASVAYVLSDPIDIEHGAMLTAFQRCAEAQIAINRTLKDKPSARAAYEVALGLAMDADSRSFQGRAAGQTGQLTRRLRDMPISFADQ